MTTSYPSGLDSFTNPTATDELDDEIGTRTHSEFHADINDAMEAVQAKLGTTTTPATFSAGSAAAPAITTTDDTNTGVYFPSADTVGVTTGGVRRLAVGATGVGFVQTAEQAAVPVATISPFTSGSEPFQIVGQSFANTGVGAGTYNHATFIGWNSGRHAGDTGVVDDKPAIMMGFEDNYYDDGGTAKYGPEWYVEYWSPDGTTQQMLRPFYCRVEGSDSNASSNATIQHDIGSDGSGKFSVFKQGMGARTYLLEILPTSVEAVPAFYATTSVNTPTVIGTEGANDNLYLRAGTASGAVVFLNSVMGATNLSISDGGTVQVRTAIQSGDGSAAAPSLSFYNDPNTGIYSQAADSIGFTAGGAEKFRVGTVVTSIAAFHTDVSVNTPIVIGNEGANDNLYLRCNTSSGSVNFMNSTAGAINFQIADAGHLGLREGSTINVGSTTGTKIAGASTQKLGFYGATPVVRPTGVTVDAAGIHAALVTLGLIAA